MIYAFWKAASHVNMLRTLSATINPLFWWDHKETIKCLLQHSKKLLHWANTLETGGKTESQLWVRTFPSKAVGEDDWLRRLMSEQLSVSACFKASKWMITCQLKFKGFSFEFINHRSLEVNREEARGGVSVKFVLIHLISPL